MNSQLLRRRGEDGATLLLVIGFMVMVGLIGAGLATQLASSSTTRVALDTARNREYAADAAILTYIPQVRANMEGNQALAPCPGPHGFIAQNPGLNGVKVQVDCDFPGVARTLSGFVQRNVEFTACPPQAGNAACPASAIIIQAQVNFASPNPPTDTDIAVSTTYIQTWNVKS